MRCCFVRIKAVGEISTLGFGVPSMIATRCFNADTLSPSSRHAHIQLFHNRIASPRFSSVIDTLMLSAAVKTAAATSLLPFDHSIMA